MGVFGGWMACYALSVLDGYFLGWVPGAARGDALPQTILFWVFSPSEWEFGTRDRDPSCFQGLRTIDGSSAPRWHPSRLLNIR